MSEFIKPEHECPFDPKQYQCDCFIAPVGSFSWALIQLKLRKRVTRSAWVNCQGNNEMYLAITPRVNDLTVEKDSAYAVDGVAVSTKYDYLTHIDLRNEHGNFVPWQPTQEDMMACDWAFFEDKVKPTSDSKPDQEVKPEPETLKTLKYNLVFDATPKAHSAPVLGKLWSLEDPVIIENNLTTNGYPYNIYWFGPMYGTSAANQIEIQFKARTGLAAQVPDLTNKTLIITVDGKKYNLGDFTEKSSNSTNHEVHLHYRKGDTVEFGKLLEQVGKKYRFHCEWYE
ncbi:MULTISPECIES: DUF2829 domain-containing protein [Xenorhabdus]|uniref:DUF2829 domain-containing protein n=1 Tax=Xenorhabdus TaxID=626 RepID=UPI00064A71E6|nr:MULTISPECIES: DUF2829 domain-containing protein [Xenorhabdus]KLU14908.1 hypothetical protein AAY47_13775 [Xenorhabdus griffiniae]KOP33253.1 hypothetical protein AFK69_10940 [Xenorhabdus sp. GDc328]